MREYRKGPDRDRSLVHVSARGSDLRDEKRTPAQKPEDLVRDKLTMAAESLASSVTVGVAKLTQAQPNEKDGRTPRERRAAYDDTRASIDRQFTQVGKEREFAVKHAAQHQVDASAMLATFDDAIKKARETFDTAPSAPVRYQRFPQEEDFAAVIAMAHTPERDATLLFLCSQLRPGHKLTLEQRIDRADGEDRLALALKDKSVVTKPLLASVVGILAGNLRLAIDLRMVRLPPAAKPAGDDAADTTPTASAHAETSRAPHAANDDAPQKIPEPIRGELESATGRPLDRVRLHAGEQGHATAEAHGARAVAIGSNIYMAKGQLDPGSPEGRGLLAHEVAHTAQADAHGDPTKAAAKREGDATQAAELEADAFAAQFQQHGGAARWKPTTAVSGGAPLRAPATAAGGTAPARATDYYNALAIFDGDRFSVSISSVPIGANVIMGADIKYVGSDDGDGHEAAFTMPTNVGQPLAVQVTPDQPDGWAKLVIDPHGDRSLLGAIKHRTKLLDGWNPRSREHTFTFVERGTPTNLSKIVVKSKEALPGTQTTTVAPGDPDPKALRIDVAALSTKRWLDEIFGDARFHVSAAKPPWATLKARIDAAAAKYAAPAAGAHDDALRLTRVGETINRVRMQLLALGAASNRDAYLPDIADEATTLIAHVRALYEGGLEAAWNGPAVTELGEADAAFKTVWYRISALYMQEGKGAHGMILSAGAAAADVQQLRGGNRPQSIYPHIEADIGVPGSNAPMDGRGANVAALQRWEILREQFLRGDTGTLQKVTKQVQDAQVMAGLAALLSTIEIFHSFEAELSGISGVLANKAPFTTNYAKVASGYRVQFEAIAANAENELKGGKSLDVVGPGAIKAFQGICNDKFKRDCDDIRSRIKTVKTIEALGKVLAIVGIAALTGGAAGAAVGGVLEGAGAGTAVVASGEFAAEVVTFTMASRAGNQAVFGGNQTSVGEDLITNALMFGFLKAASASYGRVFKMITDPRAHKTAYAVGGAMTGMVGLQVFAEIHAKAKTGKMMGWDERMAGVFSNAVMLTCMSLGGSLVKGRGRELRDQMFAFAAKTVPGAMERLNAKVADLAAELEGLKGKAPVNDVKLMELLSKVEKVWNEQVSVLAKVAESTPASGKADAAKRFKDQVAEMGTEIAKVDLQLASAGIDLDLGANQGAHLFRQLSPGCIVYKAEGLEVLRDFYQENHGKLDPVPGKDGLFYGEDASGATLYVAEGQADGYMDRPPSKPPTEVEARRSRATAERAKGQNTERAHQLRKLLAPHIHDGHVVHKFGRVIEGNGLAAAIDANTLPGAAHGTESPAVTELPATIGLGTGAETFAKLGDMPIGQSAPELSQGGGWAQGASPADMTSNHGNYTSAASVASATALTQYRSGVPILDGSALEVSTRRDATWKVPDARVRIKAKLGDGTEVYLYADATDIATGLGSPNQLEARQINNDPAKAASYKATLESDNRLVYGDRVGVQKGGAGKMVLVSGGSATGAWNASMARKLGAKVDWISRDSKDQAPPRMDDSKRRYQQVQDQLNAGEITPAQADAQLADLRAFDAARLPRNVQDTDAAFNDSGITRSVKEIQSLTPTEDISGQEPGRVKVTFTDGTSEIYDQVVVSHGTNLAAPTGATGALTLATGLKMRPVVVNGQVVALESVFPPGAVRVVGAAMWSPGWIQRELIVDFDAIKIYKKALTEQTIDAPRDSPANPLIHNVGQQIPAANTNIGGASESQQDSHKNAK